jgi:AraC-like DNA-binding protein
LRHALSRIMTEIPKTLDLFAIIIFLGVIQGLFLSIFFLNKQIRKKPSNLYMGFLMLNLSMMILEIFLVHTGYIFDVLRINNFSEPLTFAVSPLMYFYIYATINRKSPQRRWVHLLPMFLWFIYCILHYMQPYELKQLGYLNQLYPDMGIKLPEANYNDDPLGIRTYILELSMLQFIIYLIASLILVVKTFRSLGISFFTSRKQSISWLRNFIILMFIMLISVAIANTFLIVDLGMYIVGTIISVLIYATSFNVIRASDFFQDSVADPLHPKKKYEKSTLQEEEKNSILTELKKCMEVDMDYKEHLLSLQYISKKLRVSGHNISQVISEKLDQTFYEMIAAYRIKEAKSILADPMQNQMTIEDLADEVGYNSKSAFNRSFKKIEGMTPSEFREKHSRS